MAPQIVVGVLALQGGFAKHLERLRSLDVIAIEVRTKEEMSNCHGLIIPGGESTVINRLITSNGLRKAIEEFGQSRPIFGTCAGLILLSSHIQQSQIQPFGFLDITVERNAYGRQYDSFQVEVSVQTGNKITTIPAVFIRAPKIVRVGNNVQVLASYDNDPILIREKNFLGATFHPELTEDPTIHLYFLHMIKEMLKK